MTTLDETRINSVANEYLLEAMCDASRNEYATTCVVYDQHTRRFYTTVNEREYCERCFQYVFPVDCREFYAFSASGELDEGQQERFKRWIAQRLRGWLRNASK